MTCDSSKKTYNKHALCQDWQHLYQTYNSADSSVIEQQTRSANKKQQMYNADRAAKFLQVSLINHHS